MFNTHTLSLPPPLSFCLRFGDAGLHACEVLLKDMADSKRLDTNIRWVWCGVGVCGCARLCMCVWWTLLAV